MEVNVEANNNDPVVVTANIPAGAHMDAAIAGEIAGIELEVSRSALRSNTARSERRAALTLTLDMTPGTMRDLAYLLVDRLGWPAFTEPEWRRIASALNAGRLASTDRDERLILATLAERIEAAYRDPAPETYIVNTHATDEQRLDQVARELDGQEWSPDTLANIADIVRGSGRQVRDIEDMPEEDS